MCVIFIAFQRWADFPLVVAANRDEFHERPALPAQWWSDRPTILAGRDLTAGGTWMGVSRSGRFAAVTNFREPGEGAAAAKSRGALVADFLDSPAGALDYARGIDGREYAGFSLFVADGDGLVHLSNRGTRETLLLGPGIYGLSNGALDARWPKVVEGKERLERILVRATALDLEAPARGSAGSRRPTGGAGSGSDGPTGESSPWGVGLRPTPQRLKSEGRTEGALGDDLFALLADRSKASDDLLPDTGVGLERERELSSLFIVNGVHGTRASTVLLIGKDGTVHFEERRFDARGVLTGATREGFALRPADPRPLS